VNTQLSVFCQRWSAFNDKVFNACKIAGIGAPIVHMYGACESAMISRANLYQTLDEMVFANLDVAIGRAFRGT
jgi:hypothetical protein